LVFPKRRYKAIMPLLEQIDEMTLNLQHSLKQSKTILFTSARYVHEQPYVTSEIAATYARQGKKVLLIDADFYSPFLHSIFQTDNAHGLSNLLLEEQSDEGPQNTSVENLFLLPSGPLPRLDSKWVLQHNIVRLLEEQWRVYDHIFLSTPPVLEKPDTKILANICDGVVLFLKKNKTKKEDALKSIEQLKKSRETFIGSIYLA